MGDIFMPSSLTGADAAKGILEQLQKLSDPDTKKRIEADILAAHKLNETEAQKAADARALIKQHKDILDETNRVAASNIKEKESLAKEKASFRIEMEAERAKLAIEKENTKNALDKATDLNKQTAAIKEDLSDREAQLRTDRETHEANVKKHNEDKKALSVERANLDNYRNQIIALDKQTNEKVEKLKQFNF